jgi:hypothetical protein
MYMNAYDMYMNAYDFDPQGIYIYIYRDILYVYILEPKYFQL